jgi:hypothetical protein
VVVALIILSAAAQLIAAPAVAGRFSPFDNDVVASMRGLR